MDAPLSVLEIEKNLKSLLALGGSTGNSSSGNSSPGSARRGPAAASAGRGHKTVPPLQNHDNEQHRVYTAASGEAGGNNSHGSRRRRRSKRKGEPKETPQTNGILHKDHLIPSSSPQLHLQQTGNVESSTRAQDGQQVLASAVAAAAPLRSTLETAGASAAAHCQAGPDIGRGNQIKLVKQLSDAGNRDGNGTNESTYASWAALLDSNMIVELKEKSKRFPNAKYLCQLCDYHIHSIDDVLRHKDLHGHQQRVKASRDDILLERMPPPTRAHIAALENVLQRAYKANVLTSEGLRVRQSIVSTLRDTLSVKIPGLSMRLYGSCASGLALARSDVNVALGFPELSNRTEAVDLIVETLLENPGRYKFVTKNLSAKTPCVTFQAETEYGDPDTEFSLAFTDLPKVCSLAAFLRECCRLDERVRQLGVLLKLMCKMCRMDSCKDSMLPPVAFSIMAVHYAQQVGPPLLPIFHRYIDRAEEMDFIPEDDVLLAAEVASRQWTVESQQSLAELWLGMLRFFALKHDYKSTVVSASSFRPLLKSTVKWGGKKLAVQDPVCCRNNITQGVRNTAAFDYVEDCLVEAYKYFSVPQMKTGPAFRYLVSEAAASNIIDAPGTTSKLHSVLADRLSVAEQFEADIPDAELCTMLQSMVVTASPDDSFAERQLRVSTATADSQYQSSQSPKPRSRKKSSPPATAGANSLPEDHVYDRTRIERLSTSDMVFEFNGGPILKGKPLPKFCSICHQGGHFAKDCDEACLPDIKPLPAFGSGLQKVLDKFLLQILNDSEPTIDDELARDNLLQLVKRCVKKEYRDANLVLFGSSYNGFGFANSDLDICLTFEGQATIGDINTASVIERLAKCLRKERDFSSILPIPTAKVPIIKFYSKLYKLESDLSLYNTLAQRNTALLRCYSEIDKRVRLLGYGLKVFAKTCDIGDASRGSLSSYSYVLMVIYYLQQCEPPVLPVLQELREGHSPTKNYVVDGWDTYFFDRLDKLSTVWPHLGKNKKTAAELWIDMFRFYTETFDVQNTVVCIRQHKKLTRFEKLWSGPTIAIEDPFDHDHNLGAALSVKMHTYIMSVLINGRALYGTPPTESLSDGMLYDYFLHTDELIRDLVLPNDRGCRICHRIGHIARDCPIKLQRKEREKKAKRQQQQQQLDDRRANEAAASLLPPQGSIRLAGQHSPYVMVPAPAIISSASDAGAAGRHVAAAPGGSFDRRPSQPAAAEAVTSGRALAAVQQQLTGASPASLAQHGAPGAMLPKAADLATALPKDRGLPTGSPGDRQVALASVATGGEHWGGAAVGAAAASSAGHTQVGLPHQAAPVYPSPQWYPAAAQPMQLYMAAHGMTAPMQHQLQKPLLPMSQQQQVPAAQMQQSQQPQHRPSGEHRGIPPLYVQPPAAWMQQQQRQQQQPSSGLLPLPPPQIPTPEQLFYLRCYYDYLQQQMMHTVQQFRVAETQEHRQAVYDRSCYFQQQLVFVSGLLHRAASTTAMPKQELHQGLGAAAAVPSMGSSWPPAMPEPSPSSSPRVVPASTVACTTAAAGVAVAAASSVGSRAVASATALPPAKVPESRAAAAAALATEALGQSSHRPPTTQPISSSAGASKPAKSQQQRPPSRAEPRGGGASERDRRDASRMGAGSRRPVEASAVKDECAAPRPFDKLPASRKH